MGRHDDATERGPGACGCSYWLARSPLSSSLYQPPFPTCSLILSAAEFRPSPPHSLAHMSYYYPVSTFVPPTSLNVTAISAQNGFSTLECWQIQPGFTTSSQAGTTGASILQLGSLANMSYSVIPPRFNASFHNAPTNQYVMRCLSSTYSPVLTRLWEDGLHSSRVSHTSRSRTLTRRPMSSAVRTASSSLRTRRQ